MKDKYLIYQHINKINGKIYIGQTKCLNPNDRWRNGTHYEHTYFGKAIKKYGWENFDHIILEEVYGVENANIREQYWIAFYQSNNNNYGYNCTSGGKNFELNEQMKKQRSIIMKQRWQNEAFKLKMKEKKHEYWENHPEKKKEKGQSVKCIETEQVFDTYKEAGTWCGLKNYKNSFLMYFRGERQSCGKHPETKKPLHWIKIDKDNNEFVNNQNFDINKTLKKGKAKKVLCIETQMIFNSLAEAAKYYNLANSSSITNAIKGIRKSAGKHPETKNPLHWKYLEEEDK